MSTALLEDHIIEYTSDLFVLMGKETRWRAFVQKNELYQAHFRRGLRRMFADQGDEVLRNLRATKTALLLMRAPTASGVFDERKWRIIFDEFGQLQFPEIIGGRGAEEMADLAVATTFDVTNPEVTKYVSNKSFKFSQAVNAETMTSLQNAFAEAYAQGEGIPKIAKRIEAIYEYADRKRSVMIARTEVVKASNFGAEQAYIQSGVVESKEWLTAADPCPFCADMQGKTANLGQSYFRLGDSLQVDSGTTNFNYDNIDFPPLHPNCLCTLLPVLI